MSLQSLVSFVMNEFYKEKSGIYRLKVPFESIYTSVFLIEAEQGAILVDCASTAEDVDEFIIPALKKAGKNISDIIAIVLTHRHKDHAGGLERLMFLMPQVEVITDICPVIDGIYTYPMSGHTKDCIGILDERTRTLISGDGLQGDGVDKYPCYTQDREAYLRTIEKIKTDAMIENILFSHAYRPMNENGVFGREKTSDWLTKCIEYVGE